MPEYRRAKITGGTYFFTVVTFDRMRILTDELPRRILRAAFEHVKTQNPFEMKAICILPDHLHCIWSVPEQDSDYSKRWRAIKSYFTREYLRAGGSQGLRNMSRMKKGEGAVWQRRYWEHAIRDDEDLHRHLDYVHYNAVKHGLVRTAMDWPWSTFQKYVNLGLYEKGWGGPTEELSGESDSFGE